MQKKLLAAAVLSAFAGVASAQSSSVTIYGTLQGDFQFAGSSGGDTTLAPGVATAAGAASATAGGSSSRGAGGGAATATAGAGAFVAAGASPANQAVRSRSNPAGSNLGFRGTEDLGNGLSAWFQLELSTTLGAPSGTPDGANHGNAPTWRNTAVGLRSNTWGTVSVGMWDTPFNLMAVSTGNVNGRIANATTGQQANLLGTTLYGQGAWSAQNENAACLTGVGVSAASCLNAGMNFDRRQKQLLQWWSPNWNGFEARVAYAAVGFADGVTANNRAAGSIKPSIWDLSLAYNNGPLAAGYAYSNQKNLLAYAAATASTAAGIGGAAGSIGSGVGQGSWQITGFGAGGVSGSTGTGHRLGGKYTFNLGGGQSIGLGALWESLKWTLNYAAPGAGDLTEMKKTAWRLQANYGTGNHFFAFDYTRAGDMKGSITSTAAAPRAFDGSGTGARSWQLAYNYMLSKRTSVTAYYVDVRNDNNANYSGIVFAGIATAAGADPKYYGVTVRHAF
jgi:predicted porin